MHIHCVRVRTFLRGGILFQILELLLKLARNGNDLTATVRVDPRLNFRQPFGSLANEILFAEIDDVNDRLGGDQT